MSNFCYAEYFFLNSAAKVRLFDEIICMYDEVFLFKCKQLLIAWLFTLLYITLRDETMQEHETSLYCRPMCHRIAAIA